MGISRRSLVWISGLVGLPIAFAMGYAVAPRVLGDRQAEPGSQTASHTPQVPPSEVKMSLSGPGAPVRLAATLEALGKGFDGEVGVAVQSVEKGWVVALNGARKFPQQSVSKLWVAAAVMNKVDAGTLRLADTVPLTEADLTIFHQPIRKNILAGGYQPAISELLTFALTQSDNTANEALFRRVGGKAGVEGFLARAGVSGIVMAQNEIDLQMGIAGLRWNPAFSYGRTFWTARNAVPWDDRKRAIDGYVRNPPDGATPVAVVAALAKLQRGELMLKRSATYMLALMAQSKTGPERLKSGLSPGWSIAHKTGTGQVLQLQENEHAGIFTAYNDVGLITAPHGSHYAVAVMIGKTQRPVPERQALMRGVVQAVIGCEMSGC